MEPLLERLQREIRGDSSSPLALFVDEVIAHTLKQAGDEFIAMVNHDKEMIGCYEGCKCRQRILTDAHRLLLDDCNGRECAKCRKKVVLENITIKS